MSIAGDKKSIINFAPPGYYSDESEEDDFGNFSSLSHAPVSSTENIEQPKKEDILVTLFNEVQRGDVKKVKQLMSEHKIEVDVILINDWTPLLLAVSYGHYELAKLLVETKADVDQIKDQKSVLMHACSLSRFSNNYGNAFKIVKLLVENKCNVNYKNNKRMTAFLYAASTGNVSVVKFLEDCCNTNDVDNQGWNALFYAVDDNHVKLVEYLINSGWKYNIYDVRHNTPLFYARAHGFRKIEALMPNEESTNKQYESFMAEHYNFTAELKNPRFLKDVFIMLHAMRCGSMIPDFRSDPTMTLYKFLTLSKEDLIEMKIVKQYQQHRILGRLYEFHEHAYKYKSIPRIKPSLLSTHEVAMTMFSALRHYTTIRATLYYLRSNISEWDDGVLQQITNMEKEITETKTHMEKLAKRCERWDKENRPVDLITYPSKAKKSKMVYVFPIVSAIAIFLYFKYRL